ncbi:DEAD/DEAH box helicase [Sphingomonas sp. NSE70-1]|uniref:DEAD/DEAH box helicase n=1 Tax=Sphingomonas caseinilyticus TaxID=2908205 RepID=A0ABT0RUR1_9SPHN|nr:DEAD/DEAH box helicase [Sphingomonas caseinilyticus]MCL6698765.1 DEAD/DEAH box helicase [Sphingomonas caseinilyticus]
MTKFTDLGLSKPLIDALAAKNYDVPTPIQAQAIPIVLSGRDLLGIAQTGTGKTAAFMLPSLDRLVAASRNRPAPGRARMLVLAPTRELAAQIADSARTYAKGQHLSVGVIFGGVPVPRSIREVSRGLDVLVATPGRLLDLVDQRVLDLSALEILVLDEADQMLDLGFIHALKRIVQLIPKQRQTLFFSATMPKSIRQLADAYLTNPAEVAVTPVASTAERVSQTVTFVNQAEKQALLTLFFQATQIDRSLVFSRTKHGADKIVRFLSASGIDANAIHGNKSQAQRERALGLFRSGEVPILVATDIAARGIDIPGVSHVVNFDLPDVPEQYVHRIGRTARAGAEGEAIAFCSPDERINLRDIEKLVRMKLADRPLPEGFMAAVEAIKRLKPAPRRDDVRERQPHSGRRFKPTASIKADRREDGRRREDRNERQQQQRAEGGQRRDERNERQGQQQRPQRHPHRTDGPSAHRADGGQRRDGRNERQGEQQGARNHGQQRHPHRADGHPGHRQGGRPKRPFHGRGRGPNNNRAQG